MTAGDVGRWAGQRRFCPSPLAMLTLLAPLHRRDAVLELGHVAADARGGARPVQRLHAGRAEGRAGLAGGLDVEAGGEGAIAGAREHDDAHVRVGGEGGEDGAQLEPHGLEEGVELGRAVNLDVGDRGRRRGDAEVLEGCRGRHGSSHVLYSERVTVRSSGASRCRASTGSSSVRQGEGIGANRFGKRQSVPRSEKFTVQGSGVRDRPMPNSGRESGPPTGQRPTTRLLLCWDSF